MTKTDWMKGCVILWMVVLLCGCASVRDVRVLDGEIYQLDSKMNKLQKDLATVQKDVQKEIPTIKTDLGTEAKKLQADLSLRVEDLQSQIRTLSTQVDEYKEFLKRPSKELDRVREDTASQMKTLQEKGKTFEEKNKAQEDRIKGIEDQLKVLGGKIDQILSKQAEEEKAAKEKEASVDLKGVSTGAGDQYKDAYETFQKGDLEKARKKFEAFLKQYPNTELSDNAQFWIGETYYLRKDFDKAILEYEKAITKYPEGDKIPSALYKQALAFLEVGDKSSAKNILKRVNERYPHSEQAEMAKKKLDTIK